jgi:hypothetical protein
MATSTCWWEFNQDDADIDYLEIPHADAPEFITSSHFSVIAEVNISSDIDNDVQTILSKTDSLSGKGYTMGYNKVKGGIWWRNRYNGLQTAEVTLANPPFDERILLVFAFTRSYPNSIMKIILRSASVDDDNQIGPGDSSVLPPANDGTYPLRIASEYHSTNPDNSVHEFGLTTTPDPDWEDDHGKIYSVAMFQGVILTESDADDLWAGNTEPVDYSSGATWWWHVNFDQDVASTYTVDDGAGTNYPYIFDVIGSPRRDCGSFSVVSALGHEFTAAIGTESMLGHEFTVGIGTGRALGHSFSVPTPKKLLRDLSRITRRRLR